MIGDKKPKRLHSAMELRVLLEALAHFSSRPLQKWMPKGDGHPVLVIPAFMTSDALTSEFRKSLDKLGYHTYGWELGTNVGIRDSLLKASELRLKELFMQHSQPVTLIGWSLGGLYARALANMNPECVRQVITLGSPFGVPTEHFTGVQSGVARLYETLNRLDDPLLQQPHLWQETPDVPFTAMYTESDGIIHWHYCLDRHTRSSQNIRVPGSHTGLTHNPAVLYLVAERLQYKAKNWQPFQLDGWRKLIFGSQCISEVDGQDVTTLLNEEAVTLTS